MFYETNHPFLVDHVEKRTNVGVQYPVHLAAVDPDHQSVQRIVLATSRPEPVREPEEIYLVDRAQNHRDRALDNLVLDRGDRKWTLPPVRLRYIHPA